MILALLLLLLQAPAAHADERANVNADGTVFASQAGGDATAQVHFLGTGEGVLEISSGRRKKKLALAHPILLNFDFYLSKDGSRVLGLLKGSFSGTVGQAGAGGIPDGMVGLVLIRDGKVIREIQYKDLMKNPEKAWFSVSHTHWMAMSPEVDFESGKATLLTRDSRACIVALNDGALAEGNFAELFAKAQKKLADEQRKASGRVPGQTRYPTWLVQDAAIRGIAGERLELLPTPGGRVLIIGFQDFDTEARQPVRFVAAVDLPGKKASVFVSTDSRWHGSKIRKGPELLKIEEEPKTDGVRYDLELTLPGDRKLFSFGGGVVTFKENPGTVIANRKDELSAILRAIQIEDQVTRVEVKSP